MLRDLVAERDAELQSLRTSLAVLHGVLAVADADADEARRLRAEARARIEIEVFGSAAEVDEADTKRAIPLTAIPLTVKCQRRRGCAAAKCSNRTARHRPYMTVTSL